MLQSQYETHPDSYELLLYSGQHMLRLIVTELIEETTVEELDTLDINVVAQPGVVEEGDESVEELDDHEERHLPGLQ